LVKILIATTVTIQKNLRAVVQDIIKVTRRADVLGWTTESGCDAGERIMLFIQSHRRVLYRDS